MSTTIDRTTHVIDAAPRTSLEIVVVPRRRRRALARSAALAQLMTLAGVLSAATMLAAPVAVAASSLTGPVEPAHHVVRLPHGSLDPTPAP